MQMLILAHASRYHWGLVGNPRSLAVGEWQISRVYADLKQAEPSLLFAKSSLESVMRNNLSDLLPSAFEGMARAYAVRTSLNWLEITSRRRASNCNLSETKRTRRFTLTRLTKPNLSTTAEVNPSLVQFTLYKNACERSFLNLPTFQRKPSRDVWLGSKSLPGKL